MSENAKLLKEVKDNLHDLKEDFEWLLGSTRGEGTIMMLHSLRTRFKNTAGIFDKLINNYNKEEGETK